MNCPDCGSPMSKSGQPKSGQYKVQRYQCTNCPRHVKVAAEKLAKWNGKEWVEIDKE